MSYSSLRITAAAVRTRSVAYSIFGAVLTGLVGALPILVGSPEFKDLLFQWLQANPILAAFVLVAATTVVTEVMKALRNAGVIKRVEEEGDTVRASDARESAIII